jgi:hypothetical protein
MAMKLFGDALSEQATIALVTSLVIITSIFMFIGTRYVLRSKTAKINDRKVLKQVYDAGGGPNWDIKYSENWCKEDCKLGEWAGVEAGFANGHEHALELIMRGNRNLTGTLLPLSSPPPSLPLYPLTLDPILLLEYSRNVPTSVPID